MVKDVTAYAAVDDEGGVLLPTISTTASDAMQTLMNEELFSQPHQMGKALSGKLKVHRVRIEVLDAVDPSPPEKT